MSYQLEWSFTLCLLEEAVPETAEGEREVWQMYFLGPEHKKHCPWRWGTAMLGFSNSQVLKAHPEIADCESLHKVHKLAGGQVTCASNNHHCNLAC
jgi:hypothetical protein